MLVGRGEGESCGGGGGREVRARPESEPGPVSGLLHKMRGR